LFSKRLYLARKAYTRFVHDGKQGSHQEEYHKGAEIDSRILGGDDFIDRVLDRKPRRLKPKATLDKIILAICRHFQYEENNFFVPGRDRKLSEVRGMAAWLVLELGVGTLAELSRRVGRDVTTLSARVRRLQIRSKTDSELAETMEILLKAVS
jgi:chromosomal replication initiation ATPase DnaA